MVVVRAKTITFGRCFAFDVPANFRAHRGAYSQSQYQLRSLKTWSCMFQVSCHAPGLKDLVAFDDEERFQRWVEIFTDQQKDGKPVVRPFGPDPEACALPCWTFATRIPQGVYCGAVVRNAGGVLAIYGDTTSAEVDAVATLRLLLKTMRAPG